MSPAGRRIVVTRSRTQASELDALLRAAGAETILIPTIETVAPTSYCALDAALACLRSYDWVLFTSANAVQGFVGRASRLGLSPVSRRVAVVGPATAKAAEAAGLRVDLVPERFVAEALAEALVPQAAGAAMLLVRAEVAPSLLPDRLVAAGAQVTVAAAYRTVMPVESVAQVRAVFGGEAPDAVTFTSSSTVTNLLALLAAAGVGLPVGTVRASIGPVTSETLREAGLPPQVEAVEATIEGLVGALRDYWSSAGE